MSAVSQKKETPQRPRPAGQVLRAPPKSAGGGRKTAKDASEALKAKEEEYRRLNAELEAKTTALAQEAEELMKGNLSILSELESPARPYTTLHSPSPSHLHTLTSTADSTTEISKTTSNTAPSRKQRPTSTHAQQRPHTTATHTQTHTQTQRNIKTATSKPIPTVKNSVTNTDTTHLLRAEVDRTVWKLEREIEEGGALIGGHEEGEGLGYHGDDILPEAAEDMGPEATIRFLKAKLRVMQEEMDRLCQENGEKEKQLNTKEAKLKELTDQTSKLQRSHHAMQSHSDKYKQMADSLKQRCEGLEAQLVSLRKEVDSLKSTQKKSASQQGALEVRLNRALEEAERYKTSLQRAKVDSKDSSKQERQRVDQLLAENKQLEKQKSELMAAFKKQMKLIDILKRQKMHIEAAKMLSFTEEEFVKALDWGAS